MTLQLVRECHKGGAAFLHVSARLGRKLMLKIIEGWGGGKKKEKKNCYVEIKERSAAYSSLTLSGKGGRERRGCCTIESHLLHFVSFLCCPFSPFLFLFFLLSHSSGFLKCFKEGLIHSFSTHAVFITLANAGKG